MENGAWSGSREVEVVGSGPGYPCGFLFLELHWDILIQTHQNEKEILFLFPGNTTSSLLSLIPFHLNNPQLQYSIWKRRRLSLALRTVLTQYLVSNE